MFIEVGAMSVKAMSWVWDQPIERDEKFVLLAYADHADHDGNNIYPAVATVAKKTGYSERSVQRITRLLVQHSWLIEEGTSRYQTHVFSIPIYRGDILSPPTDGGTESGDLRGDILTGVTNATPGGDTHVTRGVTNATQRGDIAMSPEPSLTVNKPSIKPIKEGGKRPRDERLNHPAIVAYRTIARTTPPDAVRDDIINTVIDNHVQWGNIVKAWIGRGYNPRNVTGMLDAYRKGGINGNGNGKQDKRDEMYALLQEDK